MPTILTHTAIPLAIGLGLGNRTIPHHLLIAGVAAAILPDLDVLAFHFAIAYTDTFGHRGASHSLAFALLVACVAMLFAHRMRTTRRNAFLFMSISTASHGLLDMLTNGGHGVALWWPLSEERIFFHSQIIAVSPLSLQRIFSSMGGILQSELMWVWLPAVLACVAAIYWRKQQGNPPGKYSCRKIFSKINLMIIEYFDARPSQ